MNVQKELRTLADPERKKNLQWFFKTGPGEYGEGDEFLGLTVPQVRSVVKKHRDLAFSEIAKLVSSKKHEERLCGLLILVEQYQKGDAVIRKKVYDFYMKHLSGVNNWDLVDLSAPKIVGAYLLDKDRKVLYSFASSKNLWKRRIAVLATFAFIVQKDFKDVIAIAEKLLKDKEDLIHKAVGWMLREAGKKDVSVLTGFLDRHATKMPRTMLRYSLEKLPEQKRKKYMQMKKSH